MVLDWLKKLSVLRPGTRLLGSARAETHLMEKCVEQVERNRRKALDRAERRAAAHRKGGRAISDWSEIDRYADDHFYRRKLEECYAKARPISRAMGRP
jgi:hypothetical protein